MNTDAILAALKKVHYPGFSRDIVSFGLINGVRFEAGEATVNLRIKTGDPKVPQQLKQSVEQALKSVAGVTSTVVTLAVSKPEPAPAPHGADKLTRAPIPGVRHMIAIASGKGGVGKSTFSTNLACALETALARRGKPESVGIMDCDLYGPSIPLMMGVGSRPELRGEKLLPVENLGIRVMSIGLLIDPDSPVVWRGPLITKAIRQFAEDVDWGTLEIVLVDLPPGTGDTQLSMAQILPLDGALIVTTPQAAAVTVAFRGANLFPKVNVPILGVAENMSYLEMPDGSRQHLFGEGGGTSVAKNLGVPLLGQVPLDPRIREGGDRGLPIVRSHPDAPASRQFHAIAAALLEEIEKRTATQSQEQLP